ncbi:hypothetical protein V1517DRAFT_330501 [Lipomyces orientalis]|uniref:Uncharacterized protein n=1 Tax=Lipomyces orientalis TaxID=1233043 RepID=A0ACC3TGR2_9ASCO
MRLGILNIVLLLVAIRCASADSDTTDTPDLKIPIKSLTSPYTNDVAITYNPHKKTGKVLPSDFTDESIDTNDLVIVNGQALTNHIPTSSGAKDIFSLHLTPSGKIWHVDYTYKQNTTPRAKAADAEVRVLPTNRGPVAVLKAPVINTKQALEENKSFIQKYWMFIVPMLLVFMIGGGGGGGGGGSGQ